MNFKSENFSGVSSIVPASLPIAEQKPAAILNSILEDFRSCIEIPPEKRPDFLFTCINGEFIVKIPVSKLLEIKLSDILDNYLSTIRNSPVIIAIDLVWDQPPSSEKIFNLLANFSNWRNYDIYGVVSGHGYLYSSFVKNFEQWKCFNDGKICSWINLIWSLVTSLSYPVMLVLNQVNIKQNTYFISKIDTESIMKFARLQDQRVKLTYIEEMPKELMPGRLSRNYFDTKVENKYQQESKDKAQQYIEENRYYIEDFGQKNRQDLRNTFTEIKAPLEEKRSMGELYQWDLRKEIKDFKEEKEIGRENLRETFEERRDGRGGLVEERRIRDELYKEENRPFTSEPKYRDKLYSEKNKDELYKEEKTINFRSTIQDFHDDRYYREGSRSQNDTLSNTRTRNYSTEPNASIRSAKPLGTSSREYQEDNIHSTRNHSMGPKENQARPGILKNSNENVKNTRFPSVQLNQTITPVLSPKDALSRTFRESAFADKYEEEVTEKPNSILKNSWASEKDYNPRSSRMDSMEKKVNFSDSVFRIEDSNKDQMPEIKIVNMKISDKKAMSPAEYRSENYKYPENQRSLIDYKVSEMKTSNYAFSDYRNTAKSDIKTIETSNSWPCPKCSAFISNTVYECNSCRFINWDKFYDLKSRSPKPRSESIPVKLHEREDLSRSYRPNPDSRHVSDKYETTISPGKEMWKTREYGKEIKIEDNYISDDYARRGNRDLLFNR